MARPLDPDIFPKVLRNYVAMAHVYAAVAAVMPADDPDHGDPRKYVDRLAPTALNDLGAQLVVLVGELERLGTIGEFRRNLLLSDPNNFVLENILADAIVVDSNGRVSAAALQSMRNVVEPFLDSELFFDAMPAARHRVCAMAIDGNVAGSGFLIGPDLVMTARHVLDVPAGAQLIRRLPDDDGKTKDEPVQGSSARLTCIFDYMGLLIHTFDSNDPPKGVLIARTAPDWLAWSSQRHPQDGIGHLFRDPPSITERLDCAVIRLAERVGEMATDRGGGRMRGWLNLSDDMEELSEGQILGLLQYPARGPQKFANGLYKAYAPGKTRLWYSTDAAGGSSGSPCFDGQCRVVAFHNAGHPTQPEQDIDTRDCNQGVVITPVIEALPDEILGEVRNANAPASALWSVGEGDEVRPLLGRKRLREWIETISGAAPKKRVIVVEDRPPASDVGKTGKSFSSSILRAVMKGRPGVVIEFKGRHLETMEPEAFVTEIATQAGLPLASVPPPLKPTEERQLTRWWANDLPNWFAGLVEDAAQASGAAARDGGGIFEDEKVVLAPIWIVIDDIHKISLSVPLQECIAGLIGVTETATVLPAGLRALRWLIIGHVPDFIREKAIEYEQDQLSQSDIGENEWRMCCEAAFQSRGLADKFEPAGAIAWYDATLHANPMLDAVIETGTPDPKYLEVLAGAAADAISLMLKKATR